MKLVHLIRCVLLLSLALPLSSRLAADPKPESATPARPPLISLDFPGGTLTKFLATISENRAVSFNIIGTGNPADFSVELPPFALRNAEPHVVANVLNQLLEQRFFSLRIAGATPDSINCVLVPLNRGPERPVKPVNDFASFQLGPYLGAQSVDEIVAAIRSAWELDPTNSPNLLRLKYHPGTAILLVSAPPHGISMTRDIILNLQRASDTSHPSVPGADAKK